MKKTLLVLGVLLVLATTFVYAQSEGDIKLLSKPSYTYNDNIEEYQNDMREWHRDKIEYNRDRVNENLKEGRITKEEAEKWHEHFDYMEKWHDENGLYPGSCHGGRRGYRNGMMGRYENR
ncbi:MAG: hypothetical protein KZY61_14445 [Clostridiaceae bacterium]|nr:hypothetical protein [Clostridiaceae bacterium]MBW4859737.1 hypothetical protein [Clostridiaceae bacterium]MBW4869833.1 hypothetical protein [Clostridiaceae bacterium]